MPSSGTASACSVASTPSEDDHPTDQEADEAGAGSSDEVEPLGEVVDGEPVNEDGDAPRRVLATGHFSGPLPSPNVLEGYDRVMPGLAREIVDQWKSETAHRRATIDDLRDLDRETVRAYYAGEKRGQIFGLVLAVGVIALCALAIVLDSPAIGVAAALGAAATIIWAMRRSSVAPSAESKPKDLGDGDALEKPGRT